MEVRILLEASRELEPAAQRGLVQLKGLLIRQGYTDIIHISDGENDVQLHYFELPREKSADVLLLIKDFLYANKMDPHVRLKN